MKIRLGNKNTKDLYEERASILKCIGTPNCLKILDLLNRQDNPCVSEITKNMNISISAVSHQLSKLKAMGIVETKREGQTICYAMGNNKSAEFVKTILSKNIG